MAALAHDRDARTSAAPALDEDGLLHVGRRWVPLSRTETVLASQFVTNFGHLVDRAALVSAVWPHGTTHPRTVDQHILKLRRRIETLGLEIETIRSRGWRMRTANDDAPHGPADRDAVTVATAIGG